MELKKKEVPTGRKEKDHHSNPEAFIFADHRRRRRCRHRSSALSHSKWQFFSSSFRLFRTAARTTFESIHIVSLCSRFHAHRVHIQTNSSLFLGSRSLSLVVWYDLSPKHTWLYLCRRRVFGCLGHSAHVSVAVAAARFETPMFVYLIYGCIRIMRKLLKKGKWKYVYIRAHYVLSFSFSQLRLISFRCCSDGGGSSGTVKFRTRKSSNLGMTSIISSVTRGARLHAWEGLASVGVVDRVANLVP